MRTKHPTRPDPRVEKGKPLLTVSDLHVSYGGIKALKGISIEVARGEIVAMIGANGSSVAGSAVTTVSPASGSRTRSCSDLRSEDPTEQMVRARSIAATSHPPMSSTIVAAESRKVAATSADSTVDQCAGRRF